MLNEKAIKLKPIGFVRTESIGEEVKDISRTSRIILDVKLSDALIGIKDFSHVFVLFWMNKVSTEERKKLKVHPRGREDMPLLGVFATRTPFRTNPIGLTLVELLEVEGNVLIVRGLDAFDGTPVLDIKPYDPWDVIQEPRVPEWWKRLESEKNAAKNIS